MAKYRFDVKIYSDFTGYSATAREITGSLEYYTRSCSSANEALGEIVEKLRSETYGDFTYDVSKRP